MDTEKTLLQQIREKEQELGQRVEAVRTGTESILETARAEAEDLLCTADETGRVAAEQVYWRERGKTEEEIANLNITAVHERESFAARGEKNLPAAVDRIVRYVIME
jgi:vacuolar-type H+-ATPase subunit H